MGGAACDVSTVCAPIMRADSREWCPYDPNRSPHFQRVQRQQMDPRERARVETLAFGLAAPARHHSVSLPELTQKPRAFGKSRRKTTPCDTQGMRVTLPRALVPPVRNGDYERRHPPRRSPREPIVMWAVNQRGSSAMWTGGHEETQHRLCVVKHEFDLFDARMTPRRERKKYLERAAAKKKLFETLPPGWTVHKDPRSGEQFYYHQANNESTWRNPCRNVSATYMPSCMGKYFEEPTLRPFGEVLHQSQRPSGGQFPCGLKTDVVESSEVADGTQVHDINFHEREEAARMVLRRWRWALVA